MSRELCEHVLLRLNSYSPDEWRLVVPEKLPYYTPPPHIAHRDDDEVTVRLSSELKLGREGKLMLSLPSRHTRRRKKFKLWSDGYFEVAKVVRFARGEIVANAENRARKKREAEVAEENQRKTKVCEQQLHTALAERGLQLPKSYDLNLRPDADGTVVVSAYAIRTTPKDAAALLAFINSLEKQ